MEGSVPQKNKQDNEQTAETHTDFSATPTSSSSGSGSDPASRDNTPRSMPKFRYDKEELMKMRDMPLSKRRPACLAPIHDNADGHWDPEIWFRSFDNSRGNSPLTTVGLRERKRPADLEKDSVYKRKTADPKARVREEEGEGIVLSPQRRSFGTGCHVSVNPPRRPTSPNDVERESQATTRDHRKNGKIGSGRIQINHDRHEREYHDARGRYERDRDDHRTYERANALDRYRRDDRDNRMRERDKERNVERERSYRREYERDGRYTREGRNNRYYNRYPEEEPEWFTGGPSSQSETIELHGFEGPNKESGDGNKKSTAKKENSNKQREETRADNHENSVSEQEEEHKENKEQSNIERPGSRAGSLSIADRNGSLETNESSSPENSPQHAQQDDPPQASVGAQDFDFNVFFKTENIPGLMDSVPVEQDVPTSGSRFSQWFHGGSHHSSHTNSRRSSINDEFGYLNDLLNLSSGQKSPVIPSPPMLDPHATYYSMQEAKRASPEQQQTLLEMLHNANHGGGRIPDDLVIHNTKPEMPEKALTASDLEANLKALLMGSGGIGSNKHDAVAQKVYIPTTQPLAPVKSKVLTAAELEAALIGGDRKQTAQHIENDKKLPDHGFGPSGVLSSAPDHLHTSLPSAVMSSAGKVKTVSELEAGLKQLGFGKDMQIPVTMTAGNKQLNMESFLGTKEHTHNDVSTGQASGDMNAFNKLLGMMKASGALPEPPRMPKKQDGRTMSPINLLSQSDMVVQHRKDVLQKLIQQQQQQTKILQLQQQVKLQQAKMQQQQQQAKQQLPQQKQQQDQILKFMKQNPGLIPKPAANTSPISPSLNLLPPASPRCPSPAIPQQALLQPSPSPRAPSPIMFGSQPPMHLTAPSPIHPSQLQQSSQTLSPNTLQVGQGNGVQVMQRVPSPQELIVHTQAIMQNALLKKQLEGQKERFLKKQQDRAKSPNPLSTSAVSSTSSPSVTSPATSTPVSNKQLNPIFTPTSVIRKMVSEKVEKQQEAGEQGSPEKKMPILRVMHSDSLEDGKNSDDNTSLGQNEYFSHKVDTPPIMTVASDGSISIPVPVTPAASTAVNSSIANEKSTKDSQDGLSLDTCVSLAQTMASAQLNQNMMQGSLGSNPTTSQPTSTQSPSVHHIAASTASQGSPSHAKQPRAVMGSGMMNTQQLSQSQSQAIPQSLVQVHSQSVAQALNVPPGRPIVKGAAQMNIMTSSSQQRPVTGGSNLQQKLDNLITSRPIFGSQHNAQSQSQKTAQQLASRSAGPTVNPTLSCTAAAQFGASVAGCVPLQTGLVRPGTVGISPPTSNPILMQRMVHPSVTIPTTARGLSPRMINQLSPLNALQTAQHRSLDPRFQTGRNIYPNAVPSLMAANTNPRGTFPVNAISRALSPQPQIGPPIASFTKHDGLTGPISPGLVQHSGLNANFNALLGAQGAIDNNLAKWFGTDVLKQQNSPMPPLPGQGQKVMTVDEIERRQQMVTN